MSAIILSALYRNAAVYIDVPSESEDWLQFCHHMTSIQDLLRQKIGVRRDRNGGIANKLLR